MGFYPEKPIRIDYYPKTKEDRDEFEGLEIEDNSDMGIDFKTVDVKGITKGKTIKCSTCTLENVAIMEDVMEEMAEDIEKAVEEMEDIEEPMEEMAEDMEEAIEDMEEMAEDIAETIEDMEETVEDVEKVTKCMGEIVRDK